MKDLLEFDLGKTPDRKISKYWKDGVYPWISISDMIDDSVITKTKEKITDIALQEKFNGNLVPKGTLIMSFKLTIGKMSILGVDAQHNEAIISIKFLLDHENIQRDYLMKTLPLFTSYANTTDAIKGETLNSKILSRLLIAVPPINEQKRINGKLNKIAGQ
jgi:type I restriction enzyme S subunit